MKKYLMMGATALAFGAMFTSCSNDDGVSTQEYYQALYNQAFEKAFGTVSPNQDWGFGPNGSTRATRSQVSPYVANIDQPYTEAWVTDYLATAKEPDATNTWDNYNNTTYATNNGEGGPNYIDWSDSQQVKDRNYFFGDDGNTDTWEQRVAWALANHPTWVTYNADETYVLNFKITGTYNGYINVAGSEGILGDGTLSGAERTIVVTGTWNITEDQRIGSLGKIIIANGGTVNVASGKTLNMVNQARLVVLPGGKLTGQGKAEVNNGNAEGRENYNGGTIDVATFNNNFGKFYNYADFLVDEYQGGAKESNFYNHHLVVIGHFAGTGSTANARIFNECQFYVTNNARIRNYEGVMGSALIVGGELMFSSSEDGTNDPTYVGLAAGALVKCNTLYNNGTSWTGPTQGGYAALDIEDKISYLNWEQDHPENGGYFENNIYVYAGTWTNVPDGNGYHQTDPSDAANYALSIADYKFFNTVANCRGNGNVTKVEKGDFEVIPASNDFVLGQSGCTPGFKIKKDDDTNKPNTASLRIMVEDISATDKSDFDFNDVVFDVEATFANGETTTKTVNVTLWAAGGTLPLRIRAIDNDDNMFEVHNKLGNNTTNTMINTHASYGKDKDGNEYLAKDNVPEYRTTLTLKDSDHSFSVESFNQNVNDYIIIEVDKSNGNNDWQLITAKKGFVASKIGCPVGTPWALERKYMNDAFTSFKDWVNTANTDPIWYNTKVAANLYNNGDNVMYRQR